MGFRGGDVRRRGRGGCETARLTPRRQRGRRDARKEELASPQTARRGKMAAGDAERHGEVEIVLATTSTLDPSDAIRPSTSWSRPRRSSPC